MIYLAEVRNIEDDETKSGRVRLRLYPHEGGMDNSDVQNIKDEDLPWGMPLMSSTSASTGKVGTIPTGLQVGSRVAVMYCATDVEKRYPIIIGSFHRAFPPVTNEQQSDSNKDGMDAVNMQQAGVDLPSNARTVENNMGKNPINPRITSEDVETAVV